MKRRRKIPNICRRDTFEKSTGGKVVFVSPEGRLRLLPVVSMAAIPCARIDDAEGVPNVSRRLVALSVPLSGIGREVPERFDCSEGRCESPSVGFISSYHPAMMHRNVISCRLKRGVCVSRLANGMREWGVDMVAEHPATEIPCGGNEVAVLFIAQCLGVDFDVDVAMEGNEPVGGVGIPCAEPLEMFRDEEWGVE